MWSPQTATLYITKSMYWSKSWLAHSRLQCESQKRKPRLNFKSLKNEKTDHKTNNREWYYYFSSFIWHIDHAYWLSDGLLSNHFCKACQNCLHPSFFIVHKAVRMYLLLLCCESSRKCYHAAQQRLLGQNQFDMFYKNYCCAATHGQIWMKYVPN